jgi:hypothetical protein
LFREEGLDVCFVSPNDPVGARILACPPECMAPETRK